MTLRVEGQAAAWDQIIESTLEIPLYLCPVKGGFPSPADDFIEQALDLNRHLILHPAATYFVRVSGDSMADSGIFSGDLLVVDTALEPREGMIVIAQLSDGLTVKRLARQRGKWCLLAEQSSGQNTFPVFELEGEPEALIWGVVLHAIRSFR